MAISDMDQDDIKEIVETDTVKTAILRPEAAKKFNPDMENCTFITVEGLKLALNGFDELKRRDGSIQASMYIKINTDLGQLLYAVSDHDDANQALKEIFPGLVNIANQTGLQLVDVRAVATEGLGSLKRTKGVTDTGALMEILAEEAKDTRNDQS
jgi:hypothetical protein